MKMKMKMMIVMLWWNLFSHESYLVKKDIWWSNLSGDQSDISQRSDDLWRFNCGNVFFYLENCLKAVTDSAAQDYGEYIDWADGMC